MTKKFKIYERILEQVSLEESFYKVLHYTSLLVIFFTTKGQLSNHFSIESLKLHDMHNSMPKNAFGALYLREKAITK